MPSCANPCKLCKVQPKHSTFRTSDRARILLVVFSHAAYCIVVDDDGKVEERDVIQFEPRFAVVERKVEEHTQVIGGLREAVVSLDQRVGQLEQRVDRLEQRVDRGFERVDQRFDALDMKMSRQFHWLVGILMSALIAMLGVLGGIVSVALGR